MIKTQDGGILNVEKLTWNEVVGKIAPLNLELAKIMRKFPIKSATYSFYKASYPFGSKIIWDNQCYLPLTNSDSVAFDDTTLPKFLLDDLNYDSLTEDPLGIILNKTSETYLAASEQIRPYSLMQSGQMFGLPRAMVHNMGNTPASTLNLNLNAGARSLFMLSSISDSYHHKRLQDYYGIKLDAPLSLNDHWQLFVEIAAKNVSPWRCEIIYFPRNWIKQLKSQEFIVLGVC